MSNLVRFDVPSCSTTSYFIVLSILCSCLSFAPANMEFKGITCFAEHISHVTIAETRIVGCKDIHKA